MNRYILIIDKDVDMSNVSYSIPWNATASAFNMKTPNESINIKNNPETWLEMLGDLDEITSLFLACDLKEEEYEFLEKLHHVQQLYMYTAENVTNMNFIKNMIYLNDLYICDSKISDVTPLVELLKTQEEKRSTVKNWIEKEKMTLRNLAIINGQIEDLTPLESIDANLTEVNFSGNQIKNLPALKRLHCYYFEIERNQIESIKDFMDNHSCSLMNFRKNKIQSVEFMLERQYYVGKFYIRHNPCNYNILKCYDFRESDIDWEE